MKTITYYLTSESLEPISDKQQGFFFASADWGTECYVKTLNVAEIKGLLSCNHIKNSFVSILSADLIEFFFIKDLKYCLKLSEATP